MEGIIGRIDLEEAEDPYDPQDPERNKTGEEEKGKDRQQIDHPVERGDKPEGGFYTGLSGIQKISCPEPEGIFDDKDTNGHSFDDLQNLIIRRKDIKGLHKENGNIQYNTDHNDIIKQTAGKIVPVADLNDLKDSFSVTGCCVHRNTALG